MKKIMALLTVCAFISVLLFAKDGKTVVEGAHCSPDELKQEMAQEQEKCDRVKDDPYEDLICERSQMKMRRKAKELKECEQNELRESNK